MPGPEARLVVDVGIEVALDVHHDPQRPRPARGARPAGRAGRRSRTPAGRAASSSASSVGVAREEDDLVVAVQPRLRLGREDPVDRRAGPGGGSTRGRSDIGRTIPGWYPRMGAPSPNGDCHGSRRSGIQSRAAIRTQTGPETEEPPLLRAVRCPRVTGNPGALRQPPIHPMTGCSIGVSLSRCARSGPSTAVRPMRDALVERSTVGPPRSHRPRHHPDRDRDHRHLRLRPRHARLPRPSRLPAEPPRPRPEPVAGRARPSRSSRTTTTVAATSTRRHRRTARPAPHPRRAPPARRPLRLRRDRPPPLRLLRPRPVLAAAQPQPARSPASADGRPTPSTPPIGVTTASDVTTAIRATSSSGAAAATSASTSATAGRSARSRAGASASTACTP